MLHCVKILDYLFNWKSEIRNACNTVEGHCLVTMKIVYQHATGHFDWLISGAQNATPSREDISILSLRCKRCTFVHPVRASKYR